MVSPMVYLSMMVLALIWMKLMCSGSESSSCSTSGNRRVNLVTNPVISHGWGKDRKVFTTSRRYPWPFVAQIFNYGEPSHGDDFNLNNRNPWFSSFLVSSNPYQGNPDKNHKLWNIVSTERYIYSICRCCWNVATYEWKVHNGKIEIISFVVKCRS